MNLIWIKLYKSIKIIQWFFYNKLNIIDLKLNTYDSNREMHTTIIVYWQQTIQ